MRIAARGPCRGHVWNLRGASPRTGFPEDRAYCHHGAFSGFYWHSVPQANPAPGWRGGVCGEFCVRVPHTIPDAGKASRCLRSGFASRGSVTSFDRDPAPAVDHSDSLRPRGTCGERAYGTIGGFPRQWICNGRRGRPVRWRGLHRAAVFCETKWMMRTATYASDMQKAGTRRRRTLVFSR